MPAMCKWPMKPFCWAHAVPIRTGELHLEAALTERWDEVEHRVVLDCRENDLSTLAVASSGTLGQPVDGEVVAFGAA